MGDIPLTVASSSTDVWAFPLRVGLSATSPRYAVAFPLQSLTWVKGFSLSCACTLVGILQHIFRNVHFDGIVAVSFISLHFVEVDNAAEIGFLTER